MKIFIISGPSGSGKTTIIKKLLLRTRLKQSLVRGLTVTTRLPRRGEEQGKDYFFVSLARFLRLMKQNYFLETKYFSGHYYGTPKNIVVQARQAKQDLILCIDVEGALRLRNKFPQETVLIFVLSPSQKALKKRLIERQTESPELLKKRLRIAQKEVQYAKKYDYLVVNNKLTEAVNNIQYIILAERLSNG